MKTNIKRMLGIMIFAYVVWIAYFAVRFGYKNTVFFLTTDLRFTDFRNSWYCYVSQYCASILMAISAVFEAKACFQKRSSDYVIKAAAWGLSAYLTTLIAYSIYLGRLFLSQPFWLIPFSVMVISKIAGGREKGTDWYIPVVSLFSRNG